MKKKLAYFGVKYFPANGGVSRTTEYLIKKLKDRYDITIYCYPDKKAKTLVDQVHVVEIPEIRLGGFGVFIHFILCFLHMMFFSKYDLIHVRKIDSAFFLPLFSLKYKRIVASSHESPYVRDKWNAFAKAYFRFNERLFIRSKAAVTCISQPLCRYYKEKYNREVQFIPNGVECFDHYDQEKADEILKKNGVDEEFLFFGARRIMSTKGCHTMIKALKLTGFKGDVVIAGELNHAPSYIAELRELGTGLNLKFIGYIGDTRVLLALIKKSKFFIFPSETEGMSIMLLEAASTQTPVICSDIPENTQVFGEHEVLYFKNKDHNDLAEKMIWALDHPDEMKEKALRADHKVRTTYSGDEMVKNYMELYDSILMNEKN